MAGTSVASVRTGAGRLSKGEGSFYTPEPVAQAIVELSGMGRVATENSQVMDPAAGDGALLVAAIPALATRMRVLGLNDAAVRDRLVANIHAIELDADEASRCRQNLSDATAIVTNGLAVPDDEWDVTVGDTCSAWRRFANKMDFVLMNPPYVRIHNLSSKPASPYVTGMCDLYYAFFDYAQRMLADGGMLSAISPSSWMTSKAGSMMRDDLRSREVLRAVCDYGHLQIFAPYATTYTALVLIGTGASGDISVWGHDGEGRLAGRSGVPSASCWHQGLFMPTAPSVMDAIMTTPLGTGGVSVRNGYATNLDGLFMSEASRFSAYEIPVIKASRARGMFAIYPYGKDGALVPFADIEKAEPRLARVLTDNRDRLLARTQTDVTRWWAYGRTQGIGDTYVDKVAVQSLVLPGVPPRTAEAPAGTGVFGGIYVTGMAKGEIDAAVSSEEFFAYARALQKYKSGGYYALGGKDLGRFLSWWRSKEQC